MLLSYPVTSIRSVEVCQRTLRLHTDECLQFIDLTDRIKAFVNDANIIAGFVNIQTKHTTTAIIINENEPLLMTDLKDSLERMAPRKIAYQHDDFDIRTENMTPEEKPNGHAHCKALFLRSSECVNIINGRLDLGRWQRIFFIELDCARERSISLTAMGK